MKKGGKQVLGREKIRCEMTRGERGSAELVPAADAAVPRPDPLLQIQL